MKRSTPSLMKQPHRSSRLPSDMRVLTTSPGLRAPSSPHRDSRKLVYAARHHWRVSNLSFGSKDCNVGQPKQFSQTGGQVVVTLRIAKNSQISMRTDKQPVLLVKSSVVSKRANRCAEERPSFSKPSNARDMLVLLEGRPKAFFLCGHLLSAGDPDAATSTIERKKKVIVTALVNAS